MFALAVKKKDSNESSPKSRRAEIPATSAAQTESGSGNLPIQRKAACACGGDCPSCQMKSANLTVSEPSDALEVEADRVADRVMRMGGESFSPVENVQPSTARVQRKCQECEEEIIQRKEDAASSPMSNKAAAPSVDEVLKTGGEPLSGETKDFFEPRFGSDLSRVRVFTDSKAASSARGLNALAYTLGENIVFGENSYQPQTFAGKHLLAHELAHVRQQSGGAPKLAAPRIMRTKCGHDGQNTGCGANLGTLKFPDENYKIDDRLVGNFSKIAGGKWLTQVQTPANPRKSGKDKGFVDGLKVSDKDGALSVEVVEVKPRGVGDPLNPSGGCEKATDEAKGYVSVIEKIAPKVQTISEKISKHLPGHGFRIDGHDAPRTKAEKKLFDDMSIDVSSEEWLQAWIFYNNLQRKIPKVFKQAFSSVNVGLNSDGDAGAKYDALGYLVDCKEKTPKSPQGAGVLSYMVNKEGGISYGCREVCGVQDEEKTKAVEKVVEQPVAQPQAKTNRKPSVFNLHEQFKLLYRDNGIRPLPKDLPEIAPDQFFVVAVAEELHDGYLGALKMKNFFNLAEIKVPLWLTEANVTTLAILVAQIGTFFVVGPAVASGLSVPAAGLAVGAGAVGTTGTVAAAPTALPVILSAVAANDNAIAIIAAAAAFIFAVNKATGGSDSSAKAMVGEALENKNTLAVVDVTTVQSLTEPGARMSVNGKVYRTIVAAGSA